MFNVIEKLKGRYKLKYRNSNVDRIDSNYLRELLYYQRLFLKQLQQEQLILNYLKQIFSSRINNNINLQQENKLLRFFSQVLK